MINFNEDFKKQAYGPVDAGKYEVEIIKTEPKVSANGTKSLSISFRIRNDVEQKFKGRFLFKTLWLDKNEKYASEGWYDTMQIYWLVNTQAGGKTDFTTIDECLVYLAGTPDKKLHLVVTVDKVMDDSIGEEKNFVKDFRADTCSPSVWDKTSHADPDPFSNSIAASDSVKLPGDDNWEF